MKMFRLYAKKGVLNFSTMTMHRIAPSLRKEICSPYGQNVRTKNIVFVRTFLPIIKNRLKINF